MAAIAWLGLATTPALADGFQVAPTRLALDEDTPGAALQIANRRDETVHFRVSVHAWSQRDDGEMVLAETSDVRIYPRHLQVPGRSRAMVRVLAKRRFGAVERPYRIVVEEMPTERPSSPAGGADVRMRIAIPVFVASTAPRRDAAVEDVRLRADGEVTFAVRNKGSVHVRPRAVEVIGYDRAGREIARTREPGWYVLPGGRLRYELSLDAGTCELARVDIRVQRDDGAWERSQPVARASCPGA